MPAPLCSTHLLSGKGRAETHPLLASGSLKSGFLSGLDLEYRLLWRSCALSGAVGTYVLGSGSVQEQPNVGKTIWAGGRPAWHKAGESVSAHQGEWR